MMLFGAPGCGKGTQGPKIVEILGAQISGLNFKFLCCNNLSHPSSTYTVCSICIIFEEITSPASY